jgi:hypothetical protein
MRPLLKMDEAVKGEHTALSWADDCYYLLEFFPGKRYGFQQDNDLFKNFKRRIDRPGGIALERKEWAIRDAGRLLRPAFASLIDFGVTTLVPIPPSKVRSDLFYDSRVLRLLELACPAGADIREMIVCCAHRAPAHHNVDRPSVAALLENYRLGDAAPVEEAAFAGAGAFAGGTAFAAPVRDRIVLFDDVVTSGNHFVACRRFLLEHFPGREVIGVFLARRVLA